MCVIGFDCSTKAIHFAILDDHSNISLLEKIESQKKDIDERFYDLMDRLRIVIKKIPVEGIVVIVENAVYVQNVKATLGIMQVVAGLKLLFHLDKISLFCVDNRSWKRVVLADGKAEKEKIMKYAKTRWPENDFLEQDFADAACIALYGYFQFSKLWSRG